MCQVISLHTSTLVVSSFILHISRWVLVLKVLAVFASWYAVEDLGIQIYL